MRTVLPLPLSAIAQEIAVDISQLEASALAQDLDASYDYLGKEVSNIAEIISQLSNLDEENNSPLYQLNAHIKNGFSLAEYDAVIETLEYATIVLQKNYAQLNSADREKIAADLDEIIDNVTHGALTRRPTLVITDNIDVLGKSTFEQHMEDMRKVLDAVKKLKLKLDPSRCVLCAKSNRKDQVVYDER